MVVLSLLVLRLFLRRSSSKITKIYIGIERNPRIIDSTESVLDRIRGTLSTSASLIATGSSMLSGPCNTIKAGFNPFTRMAIMGDLPRET